MNAIGPSLRVRVASLAVAGAALIGLLVLAASIGPWTATPTASSAPDYPSGVTESLPTVTPTSHDNPGYDGISFSLQPVLIVGALVVALAVIGALVYLALQWRQRSRWVARTKIEAPAPEPPEAEPPVPPQNRAFDARIAADYVIACWEQVEGAGQAVGRSRRPEHTPTEFLDFLLTDTPADRDRSAADRLLRLYQHARFDHTALAPDTVVAAQWATVQVLAAIGRDGSVPASDEPIGPAPVDAAARPPDGRPS